MILNDVMAVILCYVISENWVALYAHCIKWLKIYLSFLRQKCSPEFLVFSDLSFTMIQCTELRYRGDFKCKRGSQIYSDFGHIEGYISETVQDGGNVVFNH